MYKCTTVQLRIVYVLPNGTNNHLKNTELIKVIISEQHTHGDIKAVNLKMYFYVYLYWCLLLQKT